MVQSESCFKYIMYKALLLHELLKTLALCPAVQGSIAGLECVFIKKVACSSPFLGRASRLYRQCMYQLPEQGSAF